MSSLLGRHKTLSELQEEDERLETEASIAEKKAMIKAAEAQAGRGAWRMFSDNGKVSGINWAGMKNWLRGGR